ncbi:MAG: response regulator transcription factor [Flavobacteriales bacterium]|nr:response regulator transcription factor [Flavobacteriales bacterium]
MSKLTPILIVEDELVIAYALKELLQEMQFTNLTIASNSTKAEILMEEHYFGLALLDINLGKNEEGIELSKKAQDMGIPFIFITSYTDKKKLDLALSYSPTAYLVKPVSEVNLYTAVKIALNLGDEKQRNILKIRNGGEDLRIQIDKILYIQADNNYVNIVTEKRKHLLRISISSIKEQLDENIFIQTHRSYLVNIQKVESICASSIKIDQMNIPISRSFKNDVKKAFLEL